MLQGERKIRVFELRQGTRTAAAGRSRIYWDLDFGLNIYIYISLKLLSDHLITDQSVFFFLQFCQEG